jgi:DNA-binding transcriptional regulator YiaG
MRKSKLSERNIQICQRLRIAREHLEISQAGCARQIGLERSTLLNYEHCRTPLRFEVALRFCRQFIISEEWLATGLHDACHKEAPLHGIPAGQGMATMDKFIFFRQCVDLLSEPKSLHIAPGTLFGEAYDSMLAPEYARLVHSFFYLPRIVLSDSDNPELISNLLTALNERFLMLLGNEALRRSQKQSSAWRVYARCMLESADLVFRKMMKFQLDLAHLNQLGWLRYCVTDPDATIGFLEDQIATPSETSKENVLTNYPKTGKNEAVKPILPMLIERLKKATSQHGQKTELASWLGVTPQKVTDWISGRVEPSGETTLRLLHWVEQQERQK